MNRSRSNRSDRPSGFSSLVKRGLKRLTGAGALAESAGSAPVSATFEQLEERQLLFSLTVDPSDPTFVPGPGGGTVTAQFAYFIPYLAPTVQITAVPAVTVTADLNQAVVGPIANDTVFGQGGQGGIRATFAGGSNGAIVQVTPQDRRGQVTLPAGSSLTLDNPSGAPANWDPDNGPLLVNPLGRDEEVSLTQMAFDIFGPNGLDPASTTVELRQRLPGGGYQVVASFTGAQLLAQSSTGGAIGRFTFNAPLDTRTGSLGAFDQLVIRNTSNTSLSFGIDNLADTSTTGTLAALTASHIFGSVVVFTGPIGATAQFLDLNGAEIVPTIFLGKWEQQQLVNRGDLNDDGVPDYNDGIGRINITGTNGLSSLTMWGTTVTGAGLTGFANPLPTSILGLGLEAAGFGYHWVAPTSPGGAFTVTGLPPATGSVVIGSPWVRNLTNYNPTGPAAGVNVVGGFNRTDQGVFVQGGAGISSIYIDGPIFGSSQLTGFADRFIATSLMGSLSVSGDLGLLMTQTDAGGWVNDDGAGQFSTGSRIVVGRTLGEISVGGRLYSGVTVIGDLGSSSARPARDILRHFENEFVTGIDKAAQPPVPPIINNILNNNASAMFNHIFLPTVRTDQALIYGPGLYRNDTIMGSEWIGNVSTSVEVHGELGLGDPINTLDDPSDVYGFAVDGTTEVQVRLDPNSTAFTLSGGYFRLVDSDGRTVASINLNESSQRESVIRYRPNVPGVLYLVVQTSTNAAGNATSLPYVINVSGMAPTTAGAIHSSGGMGLGAGNTINILSGSLGSLRAGTGVNVGAGGIASPASVFNVTPLTNPPPGSEGVPRGYLDLRTTSLSVAGNLYNITAGSDIQGASITIGGNLGSVVTGVSTAAGALGFRHGDLVETRLTVGGSIALLDIKGGFGILNDLGDPPVADLPSTVVIKTGQSPLLRGDIGMIRVGGDMGADTLSLRTPNGSVVGGLLVSQDGTFNPGGDSGIYLNAGQSGNGEDIRLGINSDLRFFDTPRIELNNAEDVFFTLQSGVPQLFTDDAGGQVRITFTAGDDATAGAIVRVIPIAQSLGAVIGRISANLNGGAQLRITSVGATGSTDVVSIGRIVITNASASAGGALPGIAIDGNTQVDVWRIDQQGGTVFGQISNNTPNGDIVAIDMVGITQVVIGSGDLGRTQVPAWGPQLIGPFLGITTQSAGNQAGGALSVTGASLTPIELGDVTFRPINDSNVTPIHEFFDDVGAPVNGYLNGVVVRQGNINSVAAGGSVGDVIANGGNIGTVLANAGGVADPNRFRGIVGDIYAQNITSVDIGDGLQARTQNALSSSGIFADNNIALVTGERVPGAFISSSIVAAGSLTAVRLSGGGDFVDAFIAGANLDAFWTSVYTNELFVTFPVGTITGTDANFLRSELTGSNITSVTLNNGFWDGSLLRATGNIATITAAGYRNSTGGGGELERHVNKIVAAGNLGTLTTFGRTGDIEDLTVTITGHTHEISANNIVRMTADSTQGYDLLSTVDSLRSSSVHGGNLLNATIGKSLRSSDIEIAGLLDSIIAGDAMTNAKIVITGPDGRLALLRARTLFTGSITTVGHTGTIEVTEGNFIGSVTTLNSLRGIPGDIDLISAAGDLDLTADISGTVARMIAGINIGNIARPGVIFVHGDVTDIEAPNGQIYSDVRVGNQLNKIVIGRVANLPGRSFLSHGSIIAFGRIEEVDISGDFGGNIISYTGGIGFVTINDGSLLSTGSIQAFDGTINNVLINRGNLYGDIHADYLILSIRLNGSDDGVFGDIGVNPLFNQGGAYDIFRNMIPPGESISSAVQGPRITAGQNIGRIILTNGSIFEATIYAKRAIGTIDVTGDLANDSLTSGTGNVIAAGSSINVIHVSGSVSNTFIMAGVRSFGADGRPGGTGADADTTQSGRMVSVTIDGSASNVLVNAGITPGADGVYDSGDEAVSLGISYVRSVTVGGVVSNVDVLADSPTLTVSPGVVRKGTNFPIDDPDLSNGDLGANPIAIPSGGTINFNWGGTPGTISFSTDKGQAWWNPATGTITLLSTSLNAVLTVNAPGGPLDGFRIITNDDASMGTITVNSTLTGASKIVVDAYLLAIHTGEVQHADIRVGMNARNITTGAFASGTITDPFWARDIVINGDYGTADTFGEARIDVLAGSTISIAGNDAGLINIDRDLSVVAVGGAMTKAQVRAGNSLGALTAASISETRISVGDTLGAVTVAGDVFDTAIQAGGDLGSDVVPGGAGEGTDQVSAGFIGPVTVGGNFARSSVVAGQLRGVDGFFGTSDDVLAPGRSTIDRVTIGGTEVGSNLNTQQYRISATGSVGVVTVAGSPPSNLGNFKVQTLTDAQPLPIIVTRLESAPDAQIWTTRIFFNQAMNVSTISPALTVSEVRDGGSTLIPLTEGIGADYVVADYDALTNSISIRFNQTVTGRDLPQSPGVPGPGVYRFDFDPAILRAAVDAARLDGNGDGFAVTGEAFSRDDIVGDAGDKLAPETDVNGTTTIDFYGPVDLSVVLDNNATPDGLPDPNTTYTVRGVIGDHPDSNITDFPAGGDTDIYKITLQAGQILRLGALQGAARFVGRELLNDAGVAQGGDTADSTQLPVNAVGVADDTAPDDFLIKRTGVYFIALSNDFPDTGPGLIPIVEPGNTNTGEYNFTVQVFDDRNSGFAAGNDSGNGDNIVNAPPVITFAGPDGVFGNGDDRASVPIGDFSFFLNPGPDGVKGTADDVVSGSNARGITSTRTNFTVLTTTIDSAIGPAGHVGVPGDVTSDVDIYQLNNGQPIAAGKKITIHVKLSDIGANLGGFSETDFSDFTSDVQFALFDVTDATDVTDGKLVFSPTDFKSVAGKPGVVAQRGGTSYGFDANGDFFITFVTPGKLGGTPGEAAKYAVYLQGAFNTDYQIVVDQSDTTQTFVMPHGPQNVFIETRGGTVDWLEAGGLISKLLPFSGSVLGFTGTINSQPIDQYILTHLVSTLQSIATAQGLNLVFSTDPNAFEFQPFSTVFLSSSNDPKTVLNTFNFGYSQHSDPFNIDQTDEAVVFAPSLNSLGYSPSQTDVDNFVNSLTAAVGRRVGELVGLRITGDSDFIDQPIDIMSANSVFNVPFNPGQTYGFPDASRPLSNDFDTVINTNFFLGQQNAFQLLSKFLAP